MRQIKIELFTLQRGVVREVKDTNGTLWEASRELSDPKPGDEVTEFLILTEVPAWTIYVEGREIGTASHTNAGEAVRLAFQAAGLTSMPEGVEVKAQGQHDAFVVFTLDGNAFCVTHKQFVDEVMKSSRWTLARQAKRAEIDALGIELGKLPRK